MVLNKDAPDKQLILNSHGIQIDVARFIDHLNANEVQFKVCEYSTQRLMDINRADGVNPEVIASMDCNSVNEPILITSIDGYEWIVDGSHRILKRHELRKETSLYVPVGGGELDPFVSPL